MSDKPDPDRYLAAARAGDLDGVRAQLAAGVAMDTADRAGRTAILLAAMNRHYAMVELLVGVGADVNRQDQTSVNPFLFGCMFNDLKLVRMMIQSGADLDRLTRFGGNGITPASEKGYLEIVQELLETTTINVNHTNWVGWTPLIEAIILNDGGERQQAIVKLLLDYGADPNMTDKYGVAPLELARQKGFREIADLLLPRANRTAV